MGFYVLNLSAGDWEGTHAPWRHNLHVVAIVGSQGCYHGHSGYPWSLLTKNKGSSYWVCVQVVQYYAQVWWLFAPNSIEFVSLWNISLCSPIFAWSAQHNDYTWPNSCLVAQSWWRIGLLFRIGLYNIVLIAFLVLLFCSCELWYNIIVVVYPVNVVEFLFKFS